MKYRRLGNTGLSVSVIGIGTWQFGGEWGKTFSQDEVDRMFGAGVSSGINLIDTAECYGDHPSETLIGDAFARGATGPLGDRHEIRTPFKGLRDRDTVYDPRTCVKQLEDRCGHADRLRRRYQFHSGTDDHFDDDGIVGELSKQKRLGK